MAISVAQDVLRSQPLSKSDDVERYLLIREKVYDGTRDVHFLKTVARQFETLFDPDRPFLLILGSSSSDGSLDGLIILSGRSDQALSSTAEALKVHFGDRLKGGGGIKNGWQGKLSPNWRASDKEDSVRIVSQS